jgi:hypothetical protein
VVLIATTRLFSPSAWGQVYPEAVSDDVPSVSVPNDQHVEEHPMRKSLFTIAAASMMFAGVAVAVETTTTTSSEWTNDQGKTFTEYSKTKNYNSVTDPKVNPTVGMELPGSITVYPLPDTMKIQSADKYRYSIINDHPVVVESTTRKVVHSWE